MKILTLVGTRPELIRLSIIIKKLDKVCSHILVYSNQNYDYNLSTIFFEQLNIRTPDYYFDFEFNSFAEFFGNSLIKFESILRQEKPDKILILGDTNTGLLSILANRYKIPIYHMEAGNRCFDNNVPEETNRKIIDSVSTYNLPYTENSKYNLLNEGYHKNFIFKTGNPIWEVLTHYHNEINNNGIIDKLKLEPKKYVLVTLHRSENVDTYETLNNIISALNQISNTHTIILPLHPRTKQKLNQYNIQLNNNIRQINPLGFFEFVKLERNAYCVISDSGTVQEECCIFNVPSITIRNTTERQETIECGSNILCGTHTEQILYSFYNITSNIWSIPNDYCVSNVSDIIINILIGK